jgi:transposase
MEITYPQAAGLDVHKKTVVACSITVDALGEMHHETRTFATMTRDLLALADWLTGHGVTHVAMESTGEFWKPVYNLLEGSFTVLVVNAQHIKSVPGRKTDVADAAWIADLLRHGLLRGSFIPPRPQRDLRDLTRQRSNLVQDQAQVVNTLQKVLEGANLKLSAVATDLQGVSARAILAGIVAGETDTTALAELARGRLRAKRAELDQALRGRVRDHHRFLIGQHLTHLDFLQEQIAQFGEQITLLLATAFPSPPSTGSDWANVTGCVRLDQVLAPEPPLGGEQAIALLDTIPGVARRVAETLVAEIGPSVEHFRSAKSLARWARLCPGNNESAGKRHSGRTGAGNPQVRTALVQAAHAAVRVKDCYLAHVYHRLAVRRGAKRALVAVAHRILIAAYHVLLGRQPYDDRALVENAQERSVEHLRRRLERHGYTVTREPLPVPA